METCLAAKELIHISHSVVDEEIAFRYLKRKSTHLAKIKEEIDVKFGIMKSWMNHQDELEWCEPAGGVVCFPRIRQEIDVDIDRFYQVLNTTYKTFVGPGHWFESERRYMRIGYGWPTKDDLEQGLQNISRAIREAEPGQS